MQSAYVSLLRPVGAVFAGALATLAFAPYGYWPLTTLSVALLLWLLMEQSPKHAAIVGFSWGMGLFVTGISWVHVSIADFGGLPVILGWLMMAVLIAYLALFPALFGYLFRRLFSTLPPAYQLLLWAPILWLLLDWLRGWLFTGFPWLWLGYSHINGPLAPLAPLAGVEAITLAIVFFSACLVLLLKYRQKTALLVAGLLSLCVALSSLPTWVSPNSDNPIDVALIQGNIAQELKWVPSQRWPTLMRYADLSRENWDADIIVWPEAAIPALEEEVGMFLSRMDDAARLNNTTLITGVLDHVGNNVFYNNILTLGNNGLRAYDYETAQRYSKHHLLPFGEFVPFESFLRPLAPIFNLPMSSFSRGDYIQPNLVAGDTHIAPALCYEVAFNEQVRRNVTDETDILLTLSNDAWFGTSIGPYQHLEIAQMRALELGKPMIRATNTGITVLIDHDGKISASAPQFQQTVLRDTLITTTGQTPYHRYGSRPIQIYLLIMLGILLFKQRQQHLAACCQ